MYNDISEANIASANAQSALDRSRTLEQRVRVLEAQVAEFQAYFQKMHDALR